jgi:hypothetical protein
VLLNSEIFEKPCHQGFAEVAKLRFNAKYFARSKQVALEAAWPV